MQTADLRIGEVVNCRLKSCGPYCGPGVKCGLQLFCGQLKKNWWQLITIHNCLHTQSEGAQCMELLLTRSTWSTACVVTDPDAKNMGWDMRRMSPFLSRIFLFFGLRMCTLVHSSTLQSLLLHCNTSRYRRRLHWGNAGNRPMANRLWGRCPVTRQEFYINFLKW